VFRYLLFINNILLSLKPKQNRRGTQLHKTVTTVILALQTKLKWQTNVQCNDIYTEEKK